MESVTGAAGKKFTARLGGTVTEKSEGKRCSAGGAAKRGGDRKTEDAAREGSTVPGVRNDLLRGLRAGSARWIMIVASGEGARREVDPAGGVRIIPRLCLLRGRC